MKRPQPDIGDILRDSYIASMGDCRKFKRLWGTEWVNGTEVMTRKQYYYPESKRSEEFEKLFRFLGTYEDIKDSKPEGIRHAWFYVNKNKNSESTAANSDFVVDNLNRMWWDPNDGEMPEDLTLTTAIVIDADVNTAKVSEAIDINAPKQVQMQAVIDNYELLWDTCIIRQEGVGVIHKGTVHDDALDIDVPDEDDLAPEDPWLSTVARYALLDDGIPCTIKNVEIGTSKKARSLVNTLVVTLEIPYKKFHVNTGMVERITKDLSSPLPRAMIDMAERAKQRRNNSFIVDNGYSTFHTVSSMAFNEEEDDLDPTLLTRDYLLWEDQGLLSQKYAKLWIKDGKKWYLKADVFDSPRDYGFSYSELRSYIFSSLDTGYKKKKGKWWQKVVAVIVFIVVAVITYFTYGATSAWMKAAAALVAAAFALSVLSLAFSAMGMESMALAFASVNKTVEPLVQIATIILIIVPIVGALQNAANQGVQAVVSSAAKAVIDNALKGIADIVAGNLTTSAALNMLTTMVKLYTIPQQAQLEKLAERNKDLKMEYEKFIEENSRESDTMQGFMRIYHKPATADWSWYASLYDLPYERGGGILSMGNIQKTTKQATRKADYGMPVFENFRLI